MNHIAIKEFHYYRQQLILFTATVNIIYNSYASPTLIVQNINKQEPMKEEGGRSAKLPHILLFPLFLHVSAYFNDVTISGHVKPRPERRLDMAKRA